MAVMSAMRPPITVGPMGRAHRPLKVSDVSCCARQGAELRQTARHTLITARLKGRVDIWKPRGKVENGSGFSTATENRMFRQGNSPLADPEVRDGLRPL